MAHYQHEQEGDSHELRSTHYQPYNHQQYQHPARTQQHNAFGDDSDSEDEHQQHPAPDDQAPPEFDVYKDFNNSGVRYTTLLHGTADDSKHEHHGDHQSSGKTPHVVAEKALRDRDDDDAAGSFIGAPASPSTSHARLQPGLMPKPSTRKGRLAQLKSGKNRWKIGSVIAFLIIACVGVVVFLLVPRQPFISFENPPTLVRKEENNLVFSAKDPTRFSFDATLDIVLDGRTSYLPTLVRDFRAIVSDLGVTSGAIQVAKSKRAMAFTASTRNLTPLTTDVHFEYSAKLPSDNLWQTWRQACGNIAESTKNGTITRPSLQLVVLVQFSVVGMLGTKSDSTQINNVGCPAELPAGAPSY